MTWTGERIERLRRSVAAGLSASAVASELGVQAAAMQKLQASEAADLPLEQSSYAVLLIETQSHHCRYPLGEPSAAMLVCGATITAGSYCARHSRIAYMRRATA